MCREGHDEANDFGGWLLFGIGSIQIDADEMIFEKGSFGGDRFDGYDSYRDRIKLNTVIIGGCISTDNVFSIARTLDICCAAVVYGIWASQLSCYLTNAGWGNPVVKVL